MTAAGGLIVLLNLAIGFVIGQSVLLPVGQALNAIQGVAKGDLSQRIEQVNHTITHMDEATQQNAALVEEVSVAATSMADQAADLAQAISVFRVEEGSRRGTAGNRRSSVKKP